MNFRSPTPHDTACKTLRAALLLVKSTIHMYKQTVLFQQNLLYILQWLKWWFLPMLGRYNTLMLK
ncbi:hypothetical protein CMR86_02580 [Escherichia coli]|nr:hypothetical protein [Escherichia coli]PDS16634.1 hypothetical protein CMR86_02580 [Escherichia coli]PIM16426.1 hypothetical protein CT149_21525 [Escherichia coli]